MNASWTSARVLSLVLIFSLAGCDGGDPSDGDADADVDIDADADGDADADADADEDADADADGSDAELDRDAEADGGDPCEAARCADGDGCCPEGCSYRSDGDCAMCDPSIGLIAPIDVCSETDPCVDLLPTYGLQGIDVIDTPAAPAVCATTDRGLDLGRPSYDDGPAITWTDAHGVERGHCEYRPVGTTTSSPRPLVFFVAGSGGLSHTVYDATSLRDKAPDFDLSGDPSRPGFILVSVQPRNLHWPTEDPQEGTKHDTFFRDLGSPSTNPDIAYYDHIIDSLAATGLVDTSRIYLTGWSNGARFAALYGIARHETPTPAGHRVAAAALYSGGDPFADVGHDHEPSCQIATYPRAALPLMLVSRTCDAIACDESQDWGIVPGNVASTWVETLESSVGADVTWVRIDFRGNVYDRCAPAGLCTFERALLNHLHWPDGVEDRGDNDHEPAMLTFLRDHPLSGS